MKLIGVDPGRTGCIAEIDLEYKIVRWMTIPFKENGIINQDIIKSCFRFSEAYYTYLEKVHGMAVWGVKNNFSFGGYYDQWRMFLDKYAYEIVPPQTWQRKVNGNSKGVKGKEHSKASFIRMNPGFGTIKKKHEGLIDAFFIAYYGGLTNNIVMPKDFAFIQVDYEDSCP